MDEILNLCKNNNLEKLKIYSNGKKLDEKLSAKCFKIACDNNYIEMAKWLRIQDIDIRLEIIFNLNRDKIIDYYIP